MPQPLTVDESSFQNPKLRRATLVASKVLADLAGKGSLFVITIFAARRMSSQSFGVFSLGSTLGWLLAVAADSGIQLHLARAVARAPGNARPLLGGWLRVRLWTTAGTLLVAAIGVAALGSRGDAAPILLLALVYACSGLIEFLHYFYRGLSRSDIESSLTICQRTATLACGLLVLAWQPTAGALAIALLVPTCVTLAISLRIATQLRPESAGPAGHGTGRIRTVRRGRFSFATCFRSAPGSFSRHSTSGLTCFWFSCGPGRRQSRATPRCSASSKPCDCFRPPSSPSLFPPSAGRAMYGHWHSCRSR